MWVGFFKNKKIKSLSDLSACKAENPAFSGRKLTAEPVRPVYLPKAWSGGSAVPPFLMGNSPDGSAQWSRLTEKESSRFDDLTKDSLRWSDGSGFPDVLAYLTLLSEGRVYKSENVLTRPDVWLTLTKDQQTSVDVLLIKSDK